MENWKDEIARRLRERTEMDLHIEKLLNKVEDTLTELIKDLRSEYHLKADVKTKHTTQGEPYWIVKIENTSV